VDWVYDEREIYRTAFARAGYVVDMCTNADDAVSKSTGRDVAAVLARILLPFSRMNGITLVEHIRKNPATRHVAAILITTRIEPKFRTAALAAGCDGYVLLPVLPDQLVHQVSAAIAARRDIKPVLRNIRVKTDNRSAVQAPQKP
jgi:CheY-like chemotaxis protein